MFIVYTQRISDRICTPDLISFFQQGWVNILAGKRLKRSIDCLVQQAIIPNAVQPAELVYELRMKQNNLTFAKNLHFAKHLCVQER